jgi:hypothetical protein
MSCNIVPPGLPNPGMLLQVYRASNGYVTGAYEVIME